MFKSSCKEVNGDTSIYKVCSWCVSRMHVIATRQCSAHKYRNNMRVLAAVQVSVTYPSSNVDVTLFALIGTALCMLSIKMVFSAILIFVFEFSSVIFKLSSLCIVWYISACYNTEFFLILWFTSSTFWVKSKSLLIWTVLTPLLSKSPLWLL